MTLSAKAARSKDMNASIPLMQHRHFAFMAGCIRQIADPAARYAAYRVFVVDCCRANPAFDRQRFYEAALGIHLETMSLDELYRADAVAALWRSHLQYEIAEREKPNAKVDP